jgi:3,5-epimerase/4-reductase
LDQILHDLLPISVDMTKKGRKGVYNFTNPGAISHNEILALYKKVRPLLVLLGLTLICLFQYIDPAFTWQNFSLEEQAKILKAGRSNNELVRPSLLRPWS